MTLSLRRRLLLVVMLPAALLAAGIAGVFAARGTQAVDDALRERGLAIVSFLAPAAEYGVISGNRTSLTGLLQAVLDQRDVAAAAIYDVTGEVLAVSGRLRLAAPERLQEAAAPRMVDRRRDRLAFAAPVVTVPLPVVDDLALAHFSAPEAAHGREIGWVFVELDTRTLDEEKRAILWTAFALALCGLGFTAWLAVRMADAVTGPVDRLAEAVGGVAHGDLDIAVKEDAAVAELRVLQGGFNAMAKAISEAHHTLQAKVDEATAQLAHQALHDPLTGLPNRRAFEEALETAVHASRRAGDQDTLCFIDLDRFKIVNDTCGHAAGDALLCRIAETIRQRVRADDLICRIGGDEFALILHGCAPEEGRRIAEHLREAVASIRFSWEGRRFTVGASIGLVRINGGVESASDVLVAADLACYAAKNGGRNRVVEHQATPAGERGCPDCQPGPGGLREAIPYERLELSGQAIVPVGADETGSWHEILLRVRNDQGVLCAPRELLTHFEGCGSGWVLDRWVAEQACMRLFSRMRGGAGAMHRIALNIGRDTILHGADYLAGLGRSIETHGLEAAQVVLEFPAELAEGAPHEALSFVQAARERGFRVAVERLDGGSSGQLRNLRPDYVKISLMRLSETYGMEAGCNLAQALCGMAAALSIPAVATEVEDPLFRQALAEYGFDYAQGFSLSAPEPFESPG